MELRYYSVARALGSRERGAHLHECVVQHVTVRGDEAQHTCMNS
jgi:hypothetical protein